MSVKISQKGGFMPSTDLAVVQLLWDLINQKTGELGKVDFLPQKPPFDFQSPVEQPFPRSTPEEQGVDSSYLRCFVSELAAHASIHMHQIMVLRHGHVIYEGGFDPYPAGIWHATYSMCKSFTGMAVGLLIGDGNYPWMTGLLNCFRINGQQPMHRSFPCSDTVKSWCAIFSQCQPASPLMKPEPSLATTG